VGYVGTRRWHLNMVRKYELKCKIHSPFTSAEIRQLSTADLSIFNIYMHRNRESALYCCTCGILKGGISKAIITNK